MPPPPPTAKSSAYGKILRLVLARGASPTGVSLLRPETIDELFRASVEGEAALEDLEKDGCVEDDPWSPWTRRGTKLNFGVGGAIHVDGLESGRSGGALSWGGGPSTLGCRSEERCRVS